MSFYPHLHFAYTRDTSSVTLLETGPSDVSPAHQPIGCTTTAENQAFWRALNGNFITPQAEVINETLRLYHKKQEPGAVIREELLNKKG